MRVGWHFICNQIKVPVIQNSHYYNSFILLTSPLASSHEFLTNIYYFDLIFIHAMSYFYYLMVVHQEFLVLKVVNYNWIPDAPPLTIIRDIRIKIRYKINEINIWYGWPRIIHLADRRISIKHIERLIRLMSARWITSGSSTSSRFPKKSH